MPLIAKEHIIIIFISRRWHAWIWIWRCLAGGGYFAARPGNSSKADAISVFVGAKVKLLFSCFRWGVTYFTGTKPLSWPRVWHPIRFLTFQENTPSSWSSREIYYDLWETFSPVLSQRIPNFPLNTVPQQRGSIKRDSLECNSSCHFYNETCLRAPLFEAHKLLSLMKLCRCHLLVKEHTLFR